VCGEDGVVMSSTGILEDGGGGKGGLG